MIIFLILAFVCAALEWVSEYKNYRAGILFSKPLTMVFLILWIWTYSDFLSIVKLPEAFPILWFVIGLAFCLAGDVLLIWRDRFFLPGLVTFLVGHVFYIVGFGRVLPPEGTWVPGLILAGMVIGVSVTVYQKLLLGMRTSGKTRMNVPVAVYAAVISVMLYAALLTLLANAWNFAPSLWVSAGALLFYVSDILNAWVEFVGPLPNARFKIMTTYHLGQIALAVGAALHFVGLAG